MQRHHHTASELRDVEFFKEKDFVTNIVDEAQINDSHTGENITEGLADEIDDLERKIIDFERQWWKYPGAKEAAIRERFDLSPTRYYATLNSLIDRPAAAAYDPLVVHRLQRLRDARKAQRSARLRDLG